MVLKLDGNSELGAHAKCDLGYFHLFTAFARIKSSHKAGFFIQKRPIFFVHSQHVLSYHLI